MLLRLCQLKSLTVIVLLLLVQACTLRKEKSAETELLTTFNPKWFSVNKSHSLTRQNGVPAPHLLFDTTPEFNDSERTVNVILAVAKNSQHAYSIDLNSGQRHYTHTYCKQKDVWNKYNGQIERPVFSIGLIPRVLDQLGESQKVIVWSKRKNFGDNAATNYHRVKLFAAYVEQICPEGNCLGKSNWLSRLVFMGVDAEDPDLANILTAADFKKAFDWEVGKATLENIDGRNFIGEQTYPSVRISELIEHDDAFDYFKKRSIFLTDVELKKIQKGCHILYDRLWTDVGEMRPEEKPANTMDELNKKVKLQESLKKQKLPVGFAARFQAFTKKYYKEISTCEKFVYHGNFNEEPEKFWFLSYVGLYYRLHREGYYFDCRNKAWQRNVLNDQGTQVHDLQRDISLCREGEIDLAMNYLPNFLASLKGEKEYFKFIDYDNLTHGTHNKIFSWVKIKNRKFDCSKDPNEKIRKEDRLFPEDIFWKERKVKDIADKLKIIF